MQHRVTVGVPFFNNRDTLEGTIRSVFAQTYPHWELLLVDDGSTDGSLELVQSIADPRVRVISDGVNRGLAIRLNQITSAARGDFVARMDADDLMHPGRLREQVEFLIHHTEIDLLASAVISIDSRSRPAGKRTTAPLIARGISFVRGRTLVHPTVMARKSWMRRNPYDEKLLRGQDYELWCRACVNEDARFARLGNPLLYYREEGSIRLSNILANYRAHNAVLWKYGAKLGGWGATIWEMAKTCGKGPVYRVAFLLGLEGALIRRRNRRLTEEERRKAEGIIDIIMSTPVPGWDGNISKNIGLSSQESAA